LNLKDKISFKLFARHHAIDIHIKFWVGNSSSVTIWLQNGSCIAKLPLLVEIYRKKMCRFMNNFLGHHPRPEWK
jgi:hypothetical protein